MDVLVWQEVHGTVFPAIEVIIRMLLEIFLYMCFSVYVCVCIRMLLEISIYLYVYACVYMCLYECLCGCINTGVQAHKLCRYEGWQKVPVPLELKSLLVTWMLR